MKSVFIAIAIAATLTGSAASAKMMACTSENMAKSVTASGGMPEGPGKAGHDERDGRGEHRHVEGRSARCLQELYARSEGGGEQRLSPSSIA